MKDKSKNMTTSKNTSKNLSVAISPSGKYIESIYQKNGIATILWTSDPDLALKIHNTNSFAKKWGTEYFSFEPLENHL